MRNWFLLLFFPFIAVVAVAQTSTPENRDQSLQACTRIPSSLERLACFDRVAGTPAMIPGTSAGVGGNAQRSEIIKLVLANESRRQDKDSSFLINESPESDGGTQIVITAPALGATAPKPYLAISCILNISRLQIVTEKPVTQNVVNIQFLLDGRPVSGQTEWQVLYSGQVVDAGRGLPAIDLIRRLSGGERLTVQSNYELLDGLVFDASNLPGLIARERVACHW